jgi:ketosteroid isomerase-like protein
MFRGKRAVGLGKITSKIPRGGPMDRKHGWILTGYVMFMTLTFGCAPQQPVTPPDTRAADEAAIRKADMEWSNAAQTKQVDTWVAYYSDDATVLPPNEPMAVSKDDIRKTIGNFLAVPGLNVKWQPTKVEVSRSGDVGYSFGRYEMTANDSKGNPITDRGKYVEVWKKQADGSWKCAVDTYNSDLPATPPSTAAASNASGKK